MMCQKSSLSVLAIISISFACAVHIRESNRRLFAVKSVARGRGVVIMVENDNEPRKEATNEAIPPGQSQKTKF